MDVHDEVALAILSNVHGEVVLSILANLSILAIPQSAHHRVLIMMCSQ